MEQDIWLRGFTATPSFWKGRPSPSLQSTSNDESEALGLGGLSPTFDDVVIAKKKDDPRRGSPIGEVMAREATARKRSSSWELRLGESPQPGSWEASKLMTNLLNPSPADKNYYSLPVSPRLSQGAGRDPSHLSKQPEYAYDDEDADDMLPYDIAAFRKGSFAGEPLGGELLQPDHEEFLSAMGGMEMEADSHITSSSSSPFGLGQSPFSSVSQANQAFSASVYGSLSSPFPHHPTTSMHPIHPHQLAHQQGQAASPSAPVLRPHAQLHPTILGHSPPAIVTTHHSVLFSPSASPGPSHSPLSISPSPHSISPSPLSISPSPISPTPLSPRSPSSPVDDDGNFGGESPNAEHPLGEHPSRTLFVRNINSNVEDEELYQVFSMYGPIRSMYTQCKHRGFVMISYFDIRHAKNAMRHLQGRVIRRRKIDIHYSIPKENPSEKDQNQGTLVVFNLDPSTTNEEIKVIFGAYGEIKEVRETPNKKHHKFIEFYDVRDAERAMKSLNKTEIKGKKIKIEPSRPGGARKTPNMLEVEEDHRRHGQPIPSPPPGMPSGLPSERAHSAPYFPTYMSGVKSPVLSPSQIGDGGLSTSMMESFHIRDYSSSVGGAQHPAAAMMGGGPRFVVPPATNGNGNNGVSASNPTWPSASPTMLNKTPASFLVPTQTSATQSSPSIGMTLQTPHVNNPTMPNNTNGASAAANNGFAGGYNLNSSLSPTLSPVLSNNYSNFANGNGTGNFGHTLNPSTATVNPTIESRVMEGGHTIYRFPLNLKALTPVISPKASPRIQSPKSERSDSEDDSHPPHTPPTPKSKFDSDKSPRGRHRGDSGAEDKAQFVLNIERVLEGADIRTTLMIKNIPNKYSQKMLLAAIDENHKGLYDFFYLPIDFKNKCNVGYAFINFIYSSSIPKFYQEFNNKKWEKFNSEKVCEITYARIQGKNALIQHFQNSSLMCEDKKCRPIIFHSEGPNTGEQPFPIGPNVRARKGSKEDTTKLPLTGTPSTTNTTPTKENGVVSPPPSMGLPTTGDIITPKLNNNIE